MPGLTRAKHTLPKFVRQALKQRGLMQAFKDRPAYQQNDSIGWITRARYPTRSKNA
jgi:hypothetical protein